MEFQFAFYGFATFAASVGYACAKRAYSYAQDRRGDHPSVPEDIASPESASDASDSSDSSFTSDENAYNDTEPMSLKRKSTTDDHDADLSERPRKRSKSPERDEPPLSESPQASELNLPSPNPEEYVTMINKQEAREVISPASGPVREPTPAPEQEPAPTPVPRPSTPPQAEAQAPTQTPAFTTPAPTSSPSPTPAFKRVANTGGFAAFAGTSSSAFSASSSPFASPSASTPFSNANANGSPSAKPVWCMTPAPVFGGGEGSRSLFDGASLDPFSPNNSEPLSALAPETRGMSLGGKALPVTQLTGEEDETVESELKGVKLFIKRGEKGYTGGMPGHIKLLSKLDSNFKKGEERLLFRREPLWKVSMNVRVKPSVRCTFDEEDNVLRVVVMEAGGEDTPEELVIYAFKRGRVSKKDFRDFCDKIVANTGFKVSPNASES